MRVLVIGAGLYGLTVADQLARAGHHVVIRDKRDHIGGNAYSYTDPATGAEIHKYGAHLFHTSNQRVWKYVNRFTEFTPYQHRVWTEHNGNVYPLPFNLATLSQLLGRRLTPQEGRAFIKEERANSGVPAGAERDNLENRALTLIGRTMYEAFVRDYTAKQWQTDPRDLPAAIITRLPVRMGYDTRYFSDTFEGLPTDGYGAWLQRMVDHPNIRVELGSNFRHFYLDAILAKYDQVVYSGPLDAFFNYSDGALSWRTVDFRWEHRPEDDFQGCPVLNYADAANPHTRSIEFRHFHPERPHLPNSGSVVAWETSRWATRDDEPYYPVNSAQDRAVLDVYRAKAAKVPRVLFGGRLGGYQYLDMHMAIGSALTAVDSLLN